MSELAPNVELRGSDYVNGLIASVVLVLCLGTSMKTRADSAWKPSRQLHINGYCYHIHSDSRDTNDFLVGLGLT